MGNVSKRQKPDQRPETAEIHQWEFNTCREETPAPGGVLQLAAKPNEYLLSDNCYYSFQKSMMSHCKFNLPAVDDAIAQKLRSWVPQA